MPFASFLGDACHVLVAINTLVFAATVLLDHPLLDPLWNEQGLCILDPDRHYFTSLDLCLYVGLVLAGILKVVLLLLKEEPGMQLANYFMERGIWIVLARSIYHGLLAAGIRWGYLVHHVVSVYIPSLLYIFYTYHTMVHTPTKGWQYALLPILVELPLAAIGWLEAMQCSQWVIRVWGQLLYEVYIPLSLLLYSMIVWVVATAQSSRERIQQPIDPKPKIS